MPNVGLKLNLEINSHMLYRLCQPGAPVLTSLVASKGRLGGAR